jgi:hypothetical protein
MSDLVIIWSILKARTMWSIYLESLSHETGCIRLIANPDPDQNLTRIQIQGAN